VEDETVAAAVDPGVAAADNSETDDHVAVRLAPEGRLFSFQGEPLAGGIGTGDNDK
jgi:hypothetical protein